MLVSACIYQQDKKTPAEMAVAGEQRAKRHINTPSSLNRDKYQCKQRIGGSI
jgi:hypothetical protein